MSEEKYPDVIELKLKPAFPVNTRLIIHFTTMKRYVIEVPDAAAYRIENGLRCRASVYKKNPKSGILKMYPYKHQTGTHPKGEIISHMDYGCVKATDCNYIIREVVPRTMGPVQMMHAIDFDMHVAKNAILDNEIIDRV